MKKPLLILDQHFRTVDELFDPETFAQLNRVFRVEGGADRPMDQDRLAGLLTDAEVLIAARPRVTAAELAGAPGLKTVIEVSGAFHGEIDYDACRDHGVEVLSCSPGFRQSVAEMGLAMILAGARGLVAEHEAFRRGEEAWLDERAGTDFSVFGQSIGFVGYGNIARELHRLLAGFSPRVSFYDPWVATCEAAQKTDSLTDLFAGNRIVVITAAPMVENRHGIAADHIDAMEPGALLVLLSRAHVIDFSAALSAAAAGRITFAADVFPQEPVPQDAAERRIPGVIFSPHRAAAVEGGRRLIGEMILHDLQAIASGTAKRMLQAVDPARVGSLVAAQENIEEDGSLDAT